VADIFDEYLSPSGTSEPLPGLDEQVVAADDAGHTFISKGRNGRRAAELYSLGIMSTFGTHGLRFWRWLFIILPSVLLFTILSTFILDREFGLSIEPQSEPMSIVFGVSFLLALLFLLVVSPFFFRSLRAVAVIAWIIAVVILALSLLMPARAHL
jgi:hypothetical protein